MFVFIFACVCAVMVVVMVIQVNSSFSCLPPFCPKGSTPSLTFTYSSNAYFPTSHTYLQHRNSINDKKNAAICVLLCIKYLFHYRAAGKHIFHPYIIHSLMLYYKVRISLSKFPNNKLPYSFFFFFFPGTRSFRHIDG